MAGDTPPCRLLAVPREIRNIIYENLNNSDDLIAITKPTSPGSSSTTNTAHMGYAPIANVFCACKQILAEYRDICYKQATLYIYASKLSLKRQTFDFKAGLCKKRLGQIRQCHVKVPFSLLQNACDPDELDAFMMGIVAGDTGDDTYKRAWTPSKAATEQLSTMMNQLANWINEEHTSVFIDVVLSNCPADFKRWAALSMVQAPTFADLMVDAFTAFAAVNRLDIMFSLYAPVSSRITAWNVDSELVDPDDIDLTDLDGKTFRQTESGLLYETMDSEQKCKWLLFPRCRCHAAGGFCGFRQHFVGLVQCCCHRSTPSEK